MVAEGGGSWETSCRTAPPRLLTPVSPAPTVSVLPFPCHQGLKKKGNEALKKEAPNITFKGGGKALLRPRMWERARGGRQEGSGSGVLGSSGVGSSHRPEMRSWSRKWRSVVLEEGE